MTRITPKYTPGQGDRGKTRNVLGVTVPKTSVEMTLYYHSQLVGNLLSRLILKIEHYYRKEGVYMKRIKGIAQWTVRYLMALNSYVSSGGTKTHFEPSGAALDVIDIYVTEWRDKYQPTFETFPIWGKNQFIVLINQVSIELRELERIYLIFEAERAVDCLNNRSLLNRLSFFFWLGMVVYCIERKIPFVMWDECMPKIQDYYVEDE